METETISKNVASPKSRMSRRNLKIMKRVSLLLFLFSLLTANVHSQDAAYQDVVYLKNGSVIHGMITEQVPNISLKIVTNSGDIFVFKMEDVEKITKEKKVVVQSQQQQNVQQQRQPIVQQNSPVYKYTFGNEIMPHGSQKSPFVAGFLSLLIPGVGQFYNGDIGGGFFFMGCNVICNSIWMTAEDESVLVVGVIGGLTVGICSIINASTIAKRVNLARGYNLANNMYLKVEPTLLQTNCFAQQNFSNITCGMSLKLSF